MIFCSKSGIISRRQAALKASFILFLFTGCVADWCFARNNVSTQLEHVGNPYLQYYPEKSRRYARNIWDMIGFRGALYLGAGNSSNEGPATNAGPVHVIRFVPATHSFHPVFKTSEEQIDEFYQFEKTLYIPGHDPKESWKLGNLYMSDDGITWQKKRTIPQAIHTYSLRFFKNRLFAALGAQNGAAIAVSDDFGGKWETTLVKGVQRFYGFLEVKNNLYVTGRILHQDARQYTNAQGVRDLDEVMECNENGRLTARHDLKSNQLFPDTAITKNKALKIAQSHSFKAGSIYLGAYIHNDHQSIPFGLYVAESLEINNVAIRRITLPENVVPWDISTLGDDVYVLGNKDNGNTNEVSVFQSNDLKEWHELMYFDSPTFSRSFARLDDHFYFSLGFEEDGRIQLDPEELQHKTGDILGLDVRSFINAKPDKNTIVTPRAGK